MLDMQIANRYEIDYDYMPLKSVCIQDVNKTLVNNIISFLCKPF